MDYLFGLLKFVWLKYLTILVRPQPTAAECARTTNIEQQQCPQMAQNSSRVNQLPASRCRRSDCQVAGRS